MEWGFCFAKKVLQPIKKCNRDHIALRWLERYTLFFIPILPVIMKRLQQRRDREYRQLWINSI